MQTIRGFPAFVTPSKTACLTAAFLAFAPVAVLAQQEPQSRGDAITFVRQRKAAALTPNRPTQGEETFSRISENDLIGRILGPSIGVGLRVGGLPTGSGFALGPRYYRPDLAGENIVLKSWAVGSIGRFYEVAASLGMPHLARDHVALELKAARNDSPAIEYYGSGPKSQLGDRSSFRREQTDVSFVAGVRPVRRHLTVGFESGLTLLNIGPGTRPGIASAEQTFSPSSSPGIDKQTDFARVGPVITLDLRDLPFDPHRGTFVQAKYLFYKGLDLDEFSFQKVTGVVEHYRPFHNEKRVIALRGSTEWNLRDRRHAVPFYMQATLGGSDDLRGYRRFRFYDDNAMTANAEYRWEVMPALDMAVFGDAGQVFSKRSTFQWKEMRGATGIGLRIKSRNAVVMRFDTGISREGVRIWLKFGHTF